MEGRGLLVCNEIQPRRAGILSSNLERLGVANALVLNEHPAKLAQRFPAYFDRILVDAPCSGEGMFRKEDAAATDWSQETVAMCAARQTEVLSSAAGMLAPGGRLVYSTCTFAPEENEGTVGRFLHTHPDFFIEQVDAPWFAPGRPDWISNPAPGLEHTFRLWPHRLHGEGHYAAVLCRKGDRVFRNAPTLASKDLPEPAQAFLHANGIPLPQGTVLSFGETWFLAPVELPPLDGLRVLRAGLELGRLHKGRFLPSHALALWLNAFPEVADLSPEGPEIAAYLRGETLRGNARGWVLVTVGGLSLGWARGADGVLKNHYPKGLRHLR